MKEPSNVEKEFYSRLKNLSDTERLEKMLEFMAFGRKLMLEGIKLDNPELSAEEAKLELKSRIMKSLNNES